MQFKVPQFLEIEDKIFGPFTFRQFAYLAGGAGLCFVVYKLLGFVFGIIPILAIATFSALLTFYRPNNKPFIDMLESGFRFFTQDKLYIWKKQIARINKATHHNAHNQDIQTTSLNGFRIDGNRLKDLAWSLDVLDLTKQKENRQ